MAGGSPRRRKTGGRCLRARTKGPPHLQPRLSNVLPSPSPALPSDHGCPAAESTQRLEIGGRLQAVVVALRALETTYMQILEILEEVLKSMTFRS
jgi:hypothetical protein